MTRRFIRYPHPMSGKGWGYYIGTSIWSVSPGLREGWEVTVASCFEPPDLQPRVVAMGHSTADSADTALLAIAAQPVETAA